MASVFISYSRRDKAFAQSLHSTLTAAGHDVWIDWEGIPPSAEWMQEIVGAIDRAYAFIFVLSPSSLVSNVCQQELDHALDSNKRIIPVVCESIDQLEVSKDLAKRNYIFLRPGDDEVIGRADLIRAVETDLEHLATHSRLLTKAREWEEKEGAASYVLRGSDLAAAETWLARIGDKQPRPSALHADYILASRAQADRMIEQERRRFAEFSFIVGNQRIESGKTAEGVAYLAQSIRYLPHDNPAISRAYSLLTQRRIPICRYAIAHYGLIRDSAFLPDGNTLVTSSDNGIVRLAKTDDGSELLRIQMGQALSDRRRVQLVAVSPANSSFAVAQWDTAFIFDKSSGKLIAGPLRHRHYVRSIAYSPNGEFLLTCCGSQTDDTLPAAQIWCVKTGARVAPMLIHPRFVEQARFSPNGSLIATASRDGKARVWDFSQTGLTDPRASSLPLDENGLLILPGGPPQEREFSHCDEVTCVSFNRDGTLLATGSNDKTVRLWNPITGSQEFPPLEHDGWVTHVSFTPDGRALVTVAVDRIMRIWELREGARLLFQQEHDSLVSHLAISPSGRAIATVCNAPLGGIHDAQIWSADTGESLTEKILSGSAITAATFSPDERYLFLGDGEGTGRLYDLAPAPAFNSPLCPNPDAREVVLVSKGSLTLRMGYEKPVEAFETATGAERPIPPMFQADLLQVAANPDETRIATLTRGHIARVWEFATKKPVTPPLAHDFPASRCHLSTAGSTLVTWPDKKPFDSFSTVAVWNLTDDPPTSMLIQPNGDLNGVDLATDAMRLLTLSNPVLQGIGQALAEVWNTATGERTVAYNGHGDLIHAGCFSPDATMVATASEDHSVHLWSTETGERLVPPLTHQGPVESVAFSPDGTQLATGSADRASRVWNVRTGELILNPLRHSAGVTQLEFHKSGRYLLTASNYEARVWELRTGEPVTDWIRSGSGTRFGPGDDFLTCFKNWGQIELFRFAPHAAMDSLDLARLVEGLWGYEMDRDKPLFRPVHPETVLAEISARYSDLWLLRDPSRRTTSPDALQTVSEWIESPGRSGYDLEERLPFLPLANAILAQRYLGEEGREPDPVRAGLLTAVATARRPAGKWP